MAIIRNCSSSNILLILFILFLHLHIHSAKHPKQDLNATGCIQSELNALMDFKGSLIDNKNVLSSWRGRECCSWHGIICHNHSGFVQGLFLSDVFPPSTSSLRGEINSSLVNLVHLEFLDLSYNCFDGLPIPAFLGSLRNLQYLRLLGAGFAGEIPQQLGNLSKLQFLQLGEYLYDRTSSSLSSKSLNWVTGLSSLKDLELLHVDLRESVDWMDSVNMISSLSYLALYGCGLTMSGYSYSSYHVNNLTSLLRLDIGLDYPLNVATFLPWLFNLSHLEDLEFLGGILRGSISNGFAKMTTLTDGFAKMTTLTSLYISGNSFTSSFPDSLCNLTALNSLELSFSDLQGSLPVCLGNLSSLTSLDLSGNKFTGEIPGELGYLTKLTHLNLYGNLFNSSIPSTLGKLTKLQTLRVSDNSLTGELSESFFKGLKSLTYLSFSTNQFLVLNVSSQWIPPFQIQTLSLDSVTQFPSWLQTQTNLKRLYLSDAKISGDIPYWCQTAFPRLRSFDLSNNSLNGSVPTFNAINNESLVTVILSDNSFSGNIPKELCNLKSLSILSLANNQLTGKIPLCLGNLWKLEELDLGNNSLCGHIPNELGYLEHLMLLHLNGNKFFGELPTSLQNLTCLRTLDLGNNELSGFLPAWIGKKFSTMQYLRLQSNNFSGQITVNFCQLPSLQILNLAQNNLVGTIPPCLGNLSKMLSEEIGRSTIFLIDLHILMDDHDKLLNIVKGKEQEYSSNLKYAKFISLSSNHLHGDIPDELMDLKGLQSLNLSNNNLSGSIPLKIDNLKNLESLDLSMNQISGIVPQSLANIDALSFLNLSFNNLTGRIPFGNHFDTLCNPSVYEGNSGVCGKQLKRRCPGDLVTSNKQNGPISEGDNNEFEFSWFYGGIGTGFIVGFLGVICPLYLNKSWRNAYFDFVENMYIRVWVAFAIKISQFRRKFN